MLLNFRKLVKKVQPDLIQLNLTPFPIVKHTKLKTFLYSYHGQDLAVVFVYGNDFKRQEYRPYLTRLGTKLFCALNAFGFSAIAALFYLRRKLRLRHNDIVSVVMDVHIISVAGGNLRVHNKYERLFCAILMIASFFNASFWWAIVYPTFLIHNDQIDTFDKLVKINPPIFIPPTLKENDQDIIQLLRYEFLFISNYLNESLKS